MGDYLLLIDGSSLLSTQFFGNLPREILFAKTTEEKEKYYHKIMMTSTGLYTNGVYGFLRMLIKIYKEQKPSHVAVAWDLTRDTFRRQKYEAYKANRSETVEPLKEQFALCQNVLKRLGVRQFMDMAYEADDFCGTLAKKFENQIPVRILTKDRDYLQLATDNTNIWMMYSSSEKANELFKKYKIEKKEANVPEKVFCLTPERIEEEYGVKPQFIQSLKGLMGDASDNIKGVAGIGEQTAVKLIQEYGTVDELYAAIRDLDKEKEKELKTYWKEKLGLKRSPLPYLLKKSDTELVGEKAAYLSEELATIECDINLPFIAELKLEDLKRTFSLDEARKIMDELEFKSLKAELESGWGEEKSCIPEERIIVEDWDEACNVIKKAKKCKTLGLHFVEENGELQGLSIAISSSLCYFIRNYFFINEDILRQWTMELIPNRTVYMLDVKSQLKWLDFASESSECSVSANLKLKDVSLGAYLLNPLVSFYPYEEISQIYTEEGYVSAKQLADKRALSELLLTDVETAGKIVAYPALTAIKAGPVILKKLKETEMLNLYEEIELPLVYSLYQMEKIGIHVKAEELEDYGNRLVGNIQSLEQEIYKETGTTFNINSPKQLGEVLFGQLKLPYGKKTKSGYSTSADILEKLAPNYPVVNKILEYRQLTKLKSTYADGLRNYISEDGRIHGTFNQTITATGRISSTEPNLQNIPVRMELGRQIRKVFVPKEGCIFLDADYSQIELRILAHMSGDEELIKAYHQAQDIHTLTASQVFHIPLDEVTLEQRRNAKAVNFGIVYGISAFGLSEDLSITRKEALQYIERYFETYPKVKEFLDGLVEQGREVGFVKTLYNRRRPIPELKSSNFMQRSFGERIAMNSPIQGTAADIMKIAMICVDERLKKEQLKSRVVLQVHDELLVETYKEEQNQVEKILLEEMYGAARLSIPLEVGMTAGNSWYETK